MGGASSEEKQLQAEQAQATQMYISQQSQLYGEQQSLLATLTPLLQQEISNPTGFSPQELADLNANNVNVTGAQYASVQKQMNLANSSQNMAGLTSGVAAGEKAALGGAAAGTLATNSNNIQLANAQLMQQNKNMAQGELLSLQAGLGGQAVNMGGVANQAENAAFNQASQINKENSQFTSGLLGGLLNTGIGVGMDFLTGGMSSLAQGNSFLEGGMSGAFG